MSTAAHPAPPVASIDPASQSHLLVRCEWLHRTVIVPAPGNVRDVPHALLQALRQLILSNNDEKDPLLQVLLHRARPDDLRITQWQPPFAACSWRPLARPLRGGKGGFGTLLKGQSRQSSAHTTRHFHDCRNLQGQRLRDVNEALHYALWKEWHDKVQAGTATQAEMLAALTNTPTGLAGWHLALPSWAEVSVPRQQRENARLLQRWQQEQTQRTQQQQQQRERSERQVAAYVQTAQQVQEQLERTVASAVQEGLRKQREATTTHKRPRTEAFPPSADPPEEPPSLVPPLALVTLSGDATITNSADTTTAWTIQGRSNFCTVGVLLDVAKLQTTSRKEDADTEPLVYYEVLLSSGTGVVQVGWARPGLFQPQSETGDGVGDDAHSWAYDPSRSMQLQDGRSKAYGILNESTTSSSNLPAVEDLRGAVIGCGWNVRTGELFFSRQGQNLRTAFSVGTEDAPSLFPAVSCDQGETVEIRLYRQEMAYCPPSAVPVGDVLVEEVLRRDPNGSSRIAEEQEDMDQKPKAIESTIPLPVADASTHGDESTSGPLVAPSESAELPPPPPEEPLDLMAWSSAQELEALGLERLKRELMAAGLKCGGTLTERAVRLFAIRGLDPSDYPKKLRAAKVPQ